ncbi:leucine-rich repeat-containing protein 47 [Aplysia californica]|uniref:Leucine-rich repeat-containing protein 47 n=1 Tax=Aplysia californica TaxID=6500 RepID=A0ABM0JS55_APLCA|nr:leucine-rich repeat-containing protein 47 [Aplysia californica]
MAAAWEEVETAQREKRRELMLHGSLVNKRIEESGLDDTIFTLENLNNLKIAGTPLPAISDGLGGLVNLMNLSLENNQLTQLPDTVGNLKSLKSLDVSGNKLTLLPESLVKLTNLQSLNTNLNMLTSFPDISNLKQLAFVSISKNKLSCLPEGICDPSLCLLSQIEADCNSITDLPPELSQLPHLMKLNVASNKLDTLPLELSESPKLKELIIADNKMKDRKMLKLADHSTKSLLSYLGTLLEKRNATDSRNKDSKKDNHKTKHKKKKGDKKDEGDVQRDVISVLQFESEGGVTISVTQPVMGVRQYIVCCIIRNLDFSKSNNMFKRFINLQTRLHETVCDKRQASTIATHDLKLVKAPLVYDAALPSEIQITPLFKAKTTTAEALMKELRDEAEAVRKEKKKNMLSGVHKYLDLLKDKSHYPCVRDSEGDVISFPPITNSEKSKISKETTDILVEVTSSLSLELCKKAMEELLLATLLTGVGTPAAATGGDAGEGEIAESKGKKEAVDTSRMRFPQSLTVEQVKILDSQGNLRVIYPSRVDLDNPAFDVVRNYE